MLLTRPCLAIVGVGVCLAACSDSTPPPVSAARASPAREFAPALPVSTATSEQGLSRLQREAKRQPDMPPAGASVDRQMRAHFHDALLIREAVVAGKPEQAASPATALALSDNLDDLPPAWRPFVARMQKDARLLTNSTSTARAAAATADLGLACGSCHRELGGPKVQSEPPPAEAATVEARMKRHVWASERLWEGLVVPADEAWNTGVKALSISPFPAEVLKSGEHAARAADDFAKLVAKAATKKTPEERAAVYAELLVTCGSCHRAIREASPKKQTTRTEDEREDRR